MGIKIKRRMAAVELADGRVLEVRIINPDVVRYEETRARLGWPTMTVKDGVGSLPPVDFSDLFQAYAALKRTGQYGGTWDSFKDADCVDLVVEEVGDADPTQPDPGSSSSPSSPGVGAEISTSSDEPPTS